MESGVFPEFEAFEGSNNQIAVYYILVLIKRRML